MIMTLWMVCISRISLCHLFIYLANNSFICTFYLQKKKIKITFFNLPFVYVRKNICYQSITGRVLMYYQQDPDWITEIKAGRKPAGLQSSDSLLLWSERLSFQPLALMVIFLRIACNICEYCSSFQTTCWDWFITGATNQQDKPVSDGSRAHKGPEVKMESIRWRIWTMSTWRKDWSQSSFGLLIVCFTWTGHHID